VRFGNVLGSSGSVVPIFKRQIERGGPVTVTDARMERYFMTIPEAVQLIIRSGSLVSPRNGGRGAELFVLDMGEPVKIVELARAMIELSGLTPERDVEIEIVGARPGEKLSEELIADYERLMDTEAEKIMRVERRRAAVEAVESAFGSVEALLAEADADTLCARMASIATLPWASLAELPQPDAGPSPAGGAAGALTPPLSSAASSAQSGQSAPVRLPSS
jgi:FlaA1/EpsC-like NDP-sugar epimerase